MSISIQNLSGHPQPFLYDPQHLKYLLDVDEGIWAVCTGHVDNLSLPRKLLSHLDQDGINLFWQRISNIVYVGVWIELKIQIGSLFRILTKNTKRYQYLICQHTFKVQLCHFLQSPTEASLLFTEFQKHLAKLQYLQ